MPAFGQPHGHADSTGLETRLPGVRDIHPPKRWSPVRFIDLWDYRELLFFLAQRDLKVRYKQALIGVAWAILQPLLMMAIFTVFLGHLAKVPSQSLPYSVFSFAGLVVWLFFANSVTSSSNSLVANSNLISKVYFPRLVIPIASVLAWLPDLGVALVVLLGLMAVNGLAPSPVLILLPLFVGLGLVSALAVAVWLSALNVAYRDIQYAAPFFIQIGLFVTPVTYASNLIPERYRLLLALNPMTGVVDGFRWSVTGSGGAPWGQAIASLAIGGLVLALGLAYFRRVEQFFADVI